MGTNRDSVADRILGFLDAVVKKDVQPIQKPSPLRRVPSFKEFSDDAEAAEKLQRAAERTVTRDLRKRLNGRLDTVTLYPSLTR